MLHTYASYVHALTHSAACHMSSKKKTHEVVICVFTHVWVSIFSCIYTCPFSPWIHTHTHIIYTQSCTYTGAHFPWCCFSRGLAEMVWNRHVFLVRVKLWPGLMAPAIRSLPRCLWFGTRLNLHLLRELHFRYIVQDYLNTVEGSQDIMLKSTPQDQSTLCTGL